MLDGKAYNVVERVVAIYPQESGQISITPARFEARVLRDGRITGRKVFESDAHTITILPIPAPPADYPDAVWLPARDVAIGEEWSRDPTVNPVLGHTHTGCKLQQANNQEFETLSNKAIHGKILNLVLRAPRVKVLPRLTPPVFPKQTIRHAGH